MTDEINITIDTDGDVLILIDEHEAEPIIVPGAQFYKGMDGKTPYIVEGYWWIGDENTGVKAMAVDGNNGKSVELQVTATHIQWRLVGAEAWTNLVALTAITGASGKSAYQSYLDTTTDNPPMTEQAWSNNIGNINTALAAILAIQL